MDIKVLEESKNKIVIEVEGEGHTFCNILKEVLWNQKGVKAAAYNIGHPLTGKPQIIVETEGSLSPRKALADASKNAAKEMSKLKGDITKGLR